MTTVVRRNGQFSPLGWGQFAGTGRDQYSLESLINGSHFKSGVPADVFESETDVRIYLSLPGLNVESLAIEALENILTVTGDQRQLPLLTSGEYRQTYAGINRYDSIGYKFSLPKLAEVEGITANYDDGILQIMVPKQDAPKPVKVNVKVNAGAPIATEVTNMMVASDPNIESEAG